MYVYIYIKSLYIYLILHMYTNISINHPSLRPAPAMAPHCPVAKLPKKHRHRFPLPRSTASHRWAWCLSPTKIRPWNNFFKRKSKQKNSTANTIGNQKHTSYSKWRHELTKIFPKLLYLYTIFQWLFNLFTWTNWCVHFNMRWEQNHTEIWCNRRTGEKYLTWQALKIFLLWTHLCMTYNKYKIKYKYEYKYKYKYICIWKQLLAICQLARTESWKFWQISSLVKC